MAVDPALLTAREKEVLRLMAAGHTAKSAASALELSVHTVNDYLAEARKKLGVASSREAARALVEAEGRPPQIVAGEQIGVPPAAAGGHNAATPAGPAARRWQVAGVIGGIVMIALVAALAMATGNPAGPTGAAPATVATPQQDRAATDAALAWIALIDAGEWATSWQRAGAMFRGGVTSELWATQVNPVRGPLGTVSSRTLKSVTAHASLPGAPDGDYRVVQFTTAFAHAPGSTETAIMMREAEGWKVVGYFIR